MEKTISAGDTHFDTDGFETIVDRLHGKFVAHADIAGIAPDGESWTLTDMVAHLIDSASNNHQRFIRLQLEKSLSFPGYDAETWKRASNVGNVDYARLVEFWRLFNWYLLEIVRRANPACLKNSWETPDGPLSLERLVSDYYSHLVWHEELLDRTVARIGDAGHRNRTVTLNAAR